jgi:heparin/heparan-sulfate lyase
MQAQAAKNLQYRIEWDAIQYLISGDRILGRRTIDSALVLLKRTELPDIGDAARVTGRMMVTGSIVYDWLYPLLTSGEKKAFIDELIRLAKTLECGYPPTMQGSVTGHSSESFVMRDMLSAGIAIYDEFPEMYDLAAARFFGEHLPARNWLYNGQAYHQGDSYGPNRFNFDVYPLFIFDRMGFSNIYNPAQQYVPYLWIYTTRPDGQRLRAGDSYLVSTPPGRPWVQYLGTVLTASYYKDGILLDQYIRQGMYNGNEDIFELLWRDTALERKSIENLPLTRYFGSPFGWMVARTGWGNDAVVAEMKINEYNFNNHQHMDAGAFQVYYKGILATASGLYSGTSGAYGSPHTMNYYWRTIAHNCLLIYDPDEKPSQNDAWKNDGGQRLPNRRNEPRNLSVLLAPENGYRTGDIVAHDFGPDINKPEYSYLKGDITKAYSGKVKEVKRTFTFLNLDNEKVPAAFIVFDKVVSSDAGFRKYWLLHSIDEPSVNGNEMIITRTGSGYNGKMVNTTLLPTMKNAVFTKVGGPGKEFWVFGTNWENEQKTSRENSYERAAWRIEVTPRIPSEEDYFLNVMQVSDANSNEKLDVRKVEGDKVTGVQISDRIVMFSRASEKIEGRFTFKVRDEKSYKILLTDLSPGTWQVLRDNKVVSTVRTGVEAGTIYFEGGKGRYTVRMIMLPELSTR